MRVEELVKLLNAKNLTEGAETKDEINCGYSCDLLSWVLAHGKPGMAWCTVQTHVNVVAVAVLMEMACVIMTEDVEPEPATLQKAKEEGMPILSTPKTAYEVCGLMSKAGIPAK